MDELHGTDSGELVRAATSKTCSRKESAALAAFYSTYANYHGCPRLWGPSFLKPHRC